MPVAIELGGVLVLVLATIVSLGFLYLYRGTLKPLLIAAADLFDSIRIPTGFHTVHLLGPVASWLRWVANEIDYGISQAVLASEKGVVLLWHGLAYQARLLGRLLGDLAETIEAHFKWIALAFPPAALLWLAVRAVRGLPALVRDIHKIEHAAVERVRKAVASLDARADAQWRRLGHGIDRLRVRLDHALAAGLAVVSGRVGALERAGERTSARLRNIDRTLVGVGAVALVGAALARLGLSWLRCRNLRRAGRAVCGMNADLLESFVVDALVLASSISIVELARECQAFTGEADAALRFFVRELR